MTETPIYSSPRKGGVDLITLCIIIALMVAFAPWTKAFAAEDVSKHWTRAHQLSLQGYDAPYIKAEPIHAAVQKNLTVGDVVDGTALEGIANRVIETERGTALYLWKTGDASSINLFQPDGEGTGFQFSMRLN